MLINLQNAFLENTKEKKCKTQTLRTSISSWYIVVGLSYHMMINKGIHPLWIFLSNLLATFLWSVGPLQSIEHKNEWFKVLTQLWWNNCSSIPWLYPDHVIPPPFGRSAGLIFQPLLFYGFCSLLSFPLPLYLPLAPLDLRSFRDGGDWGFLRERYLLIFCSYKSNLHNSSSNLEPMQRIFRQPSKHIEVPFLVD